MNDTELLTFINKKIRESFGSVVRLGMKLKESKLDPLGIVIVVLKLNKEFNIIDKEPSLLASKGIYKARNTAIDDLIVLCKQ